MDITEKKRLANEKRLKAIQEWQKNRNQKIIKIPKENLLVGDISPPNKRIKFTDVDDTNGETNNTNKDGLKLFDSDEEPEENFEDCFKIRPQYEGKNGLRLLEFSSQVEDRFKLDDRFKEDETPIEEELEEDSEKNKNIRILESILGHEVSKKHPIDVNLRRRTGIERFDPEVEDGTGCVKNVEIVQKKPRTKKRKVEPSDTAPEIPISSERYIEVSSNLKEIISSASTFSFSDKFNQKIEIEESRETDTYSAVRTDQESKPFNYRERMNRNVNDFTHSKNFEDPFFISSTDDRIKEGVEFFMRPKSLDEIRQEWTAHREDILDIFRRRKRSALRGAARQPKRNRNKGKQFSQKKQF